MNPSERGQSPEQPKPALPNVLFGREFSRPDAPYSVHVNAASCSQLLHDQGLSDPVITNMDFIVKRRPPKGIPYHGMFNPYTNNIELYSDWAWQGYNQELKSGEQSLRILQSSGFKWRRGSTEKKLRQYSHSVNPDMTREQLAEILRLRWSWALNTVALEEFWHFIDFNHPAHQEKSRKYYRRKRSLLNLLAATTAIAVGQEEGFLEGAMAGDYARYQAEKFHYKRDRLEKRAKSFVAENMNHPVYSKIIALSPNPKSA